MRIKQANVYLFQNGLEEWISHVLYQQPVASMIVNDKAVAICASVRISDTGHEAGIETLKAHWRNGHAVKVISAWASAVEKMDDLPLYSTSMANMAS